MHPVFLNALVFDGMVSACAPEVYVPLKGAEQTEGWRTTTAMPRNPP